MAEEKEDKLFQLKSLDKAWGHIVSLNEHLNLMIRRVKALEARVDELEGKSDASK